MCVRRQATGKNILNVLMENFRELFGSTNSLKLQATQIMEKFLWLLTHKKRKRQRERERRRILSGWLPLQVNNLCRVFTAIQLKQQHTHTKRDRQKETDRQQAHTKQTAEATTMGQTKDAIELVKGLAKSPSHCRKWLQQHFTECHLAHKRWMTPNETDKQTDRQTEEGERKGVSKLK